MSTTPLLGSSTLESGNLSLPLTSDQKKKHHFGCSTPNDAHPLTQICHEIAMKCGKHMIEEIKGLSCHAVFDATRPSSTRLYDAVCCTSHDDTLEQPHEKDWDSMEKDFRELIKGVASPMKKQAVENVENVENVAEDVELCVMGFEQLRTALEQQGFQKLDDPKALPALWQALNCENITPTTFHNLLKLLKLHTLCCAEAQAGLEDHTAFFGVLDWSGKMIRDKLWNNPNRRLQPFLTHRNPSVSMRWVHCADADRSMILRLAVKYELHPSAVEDVLTLQDQMPRVRRHEEHWFAVIPLLRLTAASKAILATHKKVRHSDSRSLTGLLSPTPEVKIKDRTRCVVQVEQARLALFVAGKPNTDTLISVMTKWKRSNVHDEAHLSKKDLAALNEHRRYAVDTPPSGGIFDEVVDKLKVPYSELRTGDSTWFLFTLLSIWMDNLMPIMKAYTMRLQWLSDHIARHPSDRHNNSLREIVQAKRELDWFRRKVQPMVRVVGHFADIEAFDDQVTHYLEDNEYNLTTVMEEAARAIEVCDSLRDQIYNYRDRKQNDALSYLTYVGILLVPLQFLTGFYGMNFYDEDGNTDLPGVGDLTAASGPFWFWGVGIIWTALIWLYFKWKKFL